MAPPPPEAIHLSPLISKLYSLCSLSHGPFLYIQSLQCSIFKFTSLSAEAFSLPSPFLHFSYFINVCRNISFFPKSFSTSLYWLTLWVPCPSIFEPAIVDREKEVSLNSVVSSKSLGLTEGPKKWVCITERKNRCSSNKSRSPRYSTKKLCTLYSNILVKAPNLD